MTNRVLTGIAGVHHVVSELSRRGLVALPTTKNTAAYDIVALNELGTKHANIQVKTSSKKVTFFLMPHPDKIRSGPRDFYVLVRWCENISRYECFLVRGKNAKISVQNNLKSQYKSIRAGKRVEIRPSISISANQKRWAKAWQDWKF